MAGRSRVAQQAFELAEPIVEKLGLELVDCEYKKEGTAMFLRVFIDKKGGIQIDECEKVSKALDPIFDENLKSDHDYFEVSSPGLDRPLKTVADFCRHIGEDVEVSLYQQMDKRKKFTGVIKAAGEESFTLLEEGMEYTFSYEQTASCKRSIRFS